MTARGKVSVAAESRARRWLLPKGYSRHPGDVVRLVLGILILLLTTSAINKDFLGSREAAIFRLFNTLALPDWTWPGVGLVTQLGVIGAVPLVAVVAVAPRHLRLALDAVVTVMTGAAPPAAMEVVRVQVPSSSHVHPAREG